MNINVHAAASVAGTARAAARGGEADAQAAEATRQQSTAEAPGGKPADSSAVDAGDQTGDRDGHGQQVLDVFERSGRAQEEEKSPDEEGASHVQVGSDDEPGSHLDLQA